MHQNASAAAAPRSSPDPASINQSINTFITRLKIYSAPIDRQLDLRGSFCSKEKGSRKERERGGRGKGRNERNEMDENGIETLL